MTAEQIIEFYGMRPIPLEGGYLKENIYIDIPIAREALPARYPNGRLISNTILFLVTKDSFSRMHHLPTDEVYHFYMGDPVEQLQLLPDGTGRVVRLGHDILGGDVLQHNAPADCWHGTRLVDGGEWALMGTTMAPAWDETDYSDGVREDLIARWPEFEAEIIRRT